MKNLIKAVIFDLDGVIVSTDEYHYLAKPDPEVYQLAAKRLGILPEQCIVVEDSAAGIEAAFTCGMRTAAVGYAAETGCGDWNFDKLSELVLKAV